MKEIEVEIGGEDLLMQSPHQMLLEEEAITSKLKKRDPKVEAEKVVYRRKDGYLFIPNTAIKGTIINASKAKKAGKYALQQFIASGVRVEPKQISLGIKTYNIDRRPVVIRGARIIKCRPLIKKWKVKFTVVYDDRILPNGATQTIELLKEAGERIGLLDFRPQKGGEFGTFKVLKWVNKGDKK